MKQFYYTSCLERASFNGNAGFQLRAVSQSTQISIVENVLKYSGYQLPSDMPADISPDKAPIRLAFLEIEENYFAIIHSCYVGKTPEVFINGMGRWGNYFSHGIFEINTNISARDVIYSWGNKFWRTKDPDPLNPLTLEDINSIPQELKFDLNCFESSENTFLLDGLAFLLNSYLSMKPNQRIFIAGKSEECALLIFTLCTVLPKTMLHRLTFSTYEHAPLICPAKIVCTYSDDPHNDPIRFTYNNQNYPSFNLQNGKGPTTTNQLKYTKFVIDLLSMGFLDNLESFKNICEKYQINSSTELELLYIFYEAGDEIISYDEKHASIMIKSRKITNYILSKTVGVQWIVNLSLRSESFVKDHLPLIVKNIEDTSLNEIIVNKYYDDTKKSAIKEEIDDLKWLIEKIWPVINLSIENTLVKLLIDLTSENEKPINKYSWKVRSYLISIWNRNLIIEDEALNTHFERWIIIELEDIKRIFTLNLTNNTYVNALSYFLRNQPITSEVVSILSKNKLELSIIEYLYKKHQRIALEIYKECFEQNINASLFISFISNQDSYNEKAIEFIENMLDFMRSLHKKEVLRLIKNKNIIKFINKNFRNNKTVRLWISKYLYSPDAAWLINTYDQKCLLNTIYKTNLYNNDTKTYIIQWQTLISFLEDITGTLTNKTAQDKIKDLINSFPQLTGVDSDRLKELIIEKIVLYYKKNYSLYIKDKKRDNYNAKKELTLILNNFGEILTISKDDLFYKIVECLHNNEIEPSAYENIEMIEAIIIVGLDQKESMKEPQKVTECLKEHIQKIENSGKHEVIKILEKRSKKWPSPAKEFLKKIRPKKGLFGFFYSKNK